MSPGLKRVSPPRAGFTLVELLVVILIIGILAALLLPVIFSAQVKAQNVRAHNDMAQLGNAIATFKSNFHVSYVPDRLDMTNIHTASADPDTVGYLKRVWPRLSLTDIPSGMRQSYDGNQCLVLLLCTPLYTSASKPFNGTNTQPAYFDVAGDRIVGGRLRDPWGTPYVYFTSRNGGDYVPVRSVALPSGTTPLFPDSENGFVNIDSTISPRVSPYRDGSKYAANNSFQIISAGPDLMFGPGGPNWAVGDGWYSRGSRIDDATKKVYSGSGFDDLASFSPSELGGFVNQ